MAEDPAKHAPTPALHEYQCIMYNRRAIEDQGLHLPQLLLLVIDAPPPSWQPGDIVHSQAAAHFMQ